MKRIGVVGYVNSIPLAVGIEDELPAADLVTGTPARIAEALHTGRLDVGLVPVAALEPSWPRVAGLGIASRGSVRSVLLLSRVPPERVTRLVLDPASRTSNLLARLWLRERFGRDVVSVPGSARPAERLEAGEATVVIGEDALYLSDPAPGGPQRIDLGQAWTALTGLPMVYAVWAGPGAGERAVGDALRRVYERNASRLEDLAIRAAGGDEARRRLLVEYLSRHIVYRLGPAEEAGLERFLHASRSAGLLPAGAEEIHAGD
jgi:predicted solute-binding protein